MNITYGNPCMRGAVKVENGYNFAIKSSADSIALLLYKEDSKEAETYIELDGSFKTGDVFAVRLSDINLKAYQYNYKIEGNYIADPYARTITDCQEFGKNAENPLYVSCVELEEFDWKDDRPLAIPYDECIIYKLHVRGFTKSKTSGVKQKGTFAGIIEKIPYLKELGITTIEMMPAYEFNEISRDSEKRKMDMYAPGDIHTLNYWGYTGGLHFAPKASYSATAVKKADYSHEFKSLVRELHKNGIELVMEMFFDKEDAMLISDCIRFWVMEYHIDGVHLYCPQKSLYVAAEDPILAKTKIFTVMWDGEARTDETISSKKEVYKNMGNYNSEFSKVAKRLLKGDENQLRTFIDAIRSIPENSSNIHYICSHDGFTMYDLVSYDRKHNEENGENNRDGEDFNYSWNCGAEGKTRKQKVIELRQRQIKNAFMLLMLGQGTPLIMSGDEFENSQGGNNNPYCLDNETSWVNWSSNAAAMEILEFVRKLIAFRKSHRILHMPKQLMMVDRLSCGYPDISYHGENAWYSAFENYNRHIGVMYCSKYADKDAADELIYVAYNMHWESHKLALPKIAEGGRWRILSDTEKQQGERDISDNKTIAIGPRSVVVLLGSKMESTKRSKK